LTKKAGKERKSGRIRKTRKTSIHLLFPFLQFQAFFVIEDLPNEGLFNGNWYKEVAMKGFMKAAIVLLFVAMVVCGAAAQASQVTDGQVLVVQDGTLFVRTSSGEAMSFNPYWVQKEGRWIPTGPAVNVFPALESGEIVRVTWTLDNEGRRRVDAIQVISEQQGITKGVVASSVRTQLTIRPKDEPGMVTMNPNMVQVERRWIPDPRIADKLAALRPNTRVTVSWSWDKEGRKRITDVVVGW
jgi:hypothetical protein